MHALRERPAVTPSSTFTRSRVFTFQVVLSRIRDHALSIIKPWLKEQIIRPVSHEKGGIGEL